MAAKRIRSTYLLLGVILAAFVATLVALSRASAGAGSEQHIHGGAAALVQPVVALAALTGVVCVLMIVFRNLAFIRGAVAESYFRTFTTGQPAEWVERPTRTYMNLLELPVLFYVVCILMLTTGYDQLQVTLAWVFVITRYAHAFIYIGFNHVPLRFMAYLCGVLTLVLIWTRFAAHHWQAA